MPVSLVTFATFTDLVAYSIAVPVLPDLSRRLGASPTMIGLLFASFGVTLLLVSVPMGAVSDRIGRQVPMVGGLLALAAVARRCSRRRDRLAVALRGAPRAGGGRCGHLGRRLCAHRRPVRAGGARPRDGIRHVRHQLRLHDRTRRSAGGCTRPAACGCRSWRLPPRRWLAAVGFLLVRVPPPSRTPAVPLVFGRPRADPSRRARSWWSSPAAPSRCSSRSSRCTSRRTLQLTPSRVGLVFGVAAVASTAAAPGVRTSRRSRWGAGG